MYGNMRIFEKKITQLLIFFVEFENNKMAIAGNLPLPLRWMKKSTGDRLHTCVRMLRRNTAYKSVITNTVAPNCVFLLQLSLLFTD
jgi:hypothetical protein